MAAAPRPLRLLHRAPPPPPGVVRHCRHPPPPRPLAQPPPPPLRHPRHRARQRVARRLLPRPARRHCTASAVGKDGRAARVARRGVPASIPTTGTPSACKQVSVGIMQISDHRRVRLLFVDTLANVVIHSKDEIGVHTSAGCKSQQSVSLVTFVCFSRWSSQILKSPQRRPSIEQRGTRRYLSAVSIYQKNNARYMYAAQKRLESTWAYMMQINPFLTRMGHGHKKKPRPYHIRMWRSSSSSQQHKLDPWTKMGN